MDIEKLTIGAGDVVIVRTNRDTDLQPIARATGAHIVAIGADEQIESLDTARLRRLGFVPAAHLEAARADSANVSELGAEIAKRDAKLAEADEVITSQRAACAGLQDDLQAATAKIAELQNSHNAALGSLASDKQAEIDALNAEKAHLEAQVASLTQRVGELEAAANAAADQPAE